MLLHQLNPLRRNRLKQCRKLPRRKLRTKKRTPSRKLSQPRNRLPRKKPRRRRSTRRNRKPFGIVLFSCQRAKQVAFSTQSPDPLEDLRCPPAPPFPSQDLKDLHD